MPAASGAPTLRRERPLSVSPTPSAPLGSATGVASNAAPESEPLPALPQPAPPAATPEPRLLLEPPYSVLGHPQLATEMLTLARDEELFQWALGGSSDPSHPSNRAGYHPATRVVIDVELLSRAPKGSTRRLQALARSNGYWRVRACFEVAQRLVAKPERQARVRLTLSAQGRVLGARSLPTTAERPYAQCVLERLRGLDFSPGFTRKLDVELRAKQWPGNAPVPPRAPASEPALRLSAEARAAFEAATPALGDCYRAALAADPRLWGRLALKLRIVDGAVTEATQVETQLPSDGLVACARQAVLGARIPTTVSELTFAVRFGQPPAPPAGEPPSVTAGAPASPGPEPPAPGAPPEPVH